MRYEKHLVGKYRRLRRGGGFTLIEILIAMSLLAIMTTIVWSSVTTVFQTRDIVEERYERYQMVRLAMNRMATEISSAYLAGPDNGGEEIPGEEIIAMADDEGETGFAAYREPVQFGMIGRDDRLNFTSFAHRRTLENERASHHVELGYFVRRDIDENGRSVQMLMRRQDTTIDDDITRGGIVHVMIPEIESIKFEYWDAGEVQLGTLREVAQGRWVSDWDTSQRQHAGRLPNRVRITLTLPPQGPRGSQETFVTQTNLALTEVLEF